MAIRTVKKIEGIVLERYGNEIAGAKRNLYQENVIVFLILEIS